MDDGDSINNLTVVHRAVNYGKVDSTGIIEGLLSDP